MIKKLYIFLILITQSIFCQNAFLKYYNYDIPNKTIIDRGEKLLEVNDGYIIKGYSEVAENDQNGNRQDTTRPMYIKVDKHGNVLWNKKYKNQTCSFIISDFISNSNNEYIGVGTTLTSGDSCGYFPNNTPIVDNQLYIQKINENGDLVWQKNIGESITKTGQGASDITKSKDGNYFVIGSDNNYTWLLKINDQGDTLWTKKYNSLYDKSPINISSISDGYLIFALTYSNTYISKINEQGGLLWTKSLPFRAEGLKQNNDGNFILSRTNKPYTQIFTVLTNIDKDINIIWEKSYPYYGVWALINTKDNDYVIGTKDFAKVSLTGDTIWNKRFWGTNNITPWYYFLDVIQTSDGGYLATGFYERHTFLIKTDCNGNIEWDTNSCILPTDKSILVFPNPTSDFITFQFPNINKDIDKITIKIIDMLGQILIDNTYTNQNIITLNLQNYSQGIYIYSVFVNNKIYKTDKIIKQ